MFLLKSFYLSLVLTLCFTQAAFAAEECNIPGEGLAITFDNEQKVTGLTLDVIQFESTFFCMLFRIDWAFSADAMINVVQQACELRSDPPDTICVPGEGASDAECGLAGAILCGPSGCQATLKTKGTLTIPTCDEAKGGDKKGS